MRHAGKHSLRWVVLFIFTLFILIARDSIAGQLKPGAIEGAVIRLESNEPVSGATVQLHPVNERETYVVQTSGDGKFQFRNIPPGEYELSATRSGFVRSEYGKRRTTDPGGTLKVESSRTLSNIQLVLIPAGAIDGHAIDSHGDPVAAAVIRAFANAYVDGRRALRIVQTVTTDDLGSFRFFSLPPGKYYLNAGILSDVASAPTFYPQTSDIETAGAIDVAGGSTVSGIDIRILSQPRRHIRGTVRFADPDNAYATVQLVPRIPILNSSPIAAGTNRDSGAFDIPAVFPGSYLLLVNSQNLVTQTTVEIGNADVNGLEIAIPTPVEVPVHVSLDPNTAGADRINISEIVLGVRPSLAAPRIPFGTGIFTVYGQGDAFTIRIAPGEYRIFAEAIPTNGYIQSVRLGTSDILNDGLHLDSNFDGRVEVVIGSNPGTLEGTVTTVRQQPAANTILVLAPDVAHRQRLDLFRSIYTDISGHFKIENIPPGEYSVFSWEDIEPSSWMNPEFMSAYEDKGTTTHIQPGSRQDISVTAIPRP